MSKKLSELTISEAHQLLKNKEISASELLKAVLDEIDRKESKIKAFITVVKEQAFKHAQEIDKEILQGKEVKPLTGIPYSLKDIFCTKGIKTTAASTILKNFIPTFNATVVEKLHAEGAILVGKTNCDAFGHGSSTENSDFGPTHNPYNLAYVPGGSSGGSAASVAANMCLFSIAEDTGGSIRQPASFCGLTGLKVTYGRVSRYGAIAYASSLDSIGPLTKTAMDAAIVLKAIAGQDVFDATTPAVKVPDYPQLSSSSIKNMTIGIPQEYFAEGLDEEVKNSLQQAISKLKELGVQTKNVSLPHTKYAIATYYIIATSETSSNLARYDGIRYGHSEQSAKTLLETYCKSRATGFGAEAKRRIMLGTYALSAGYYEAYYKKAMQVRTLIKQDFEKVFKEVDILITPTSPVPPFKLGAKTHDPLAMYLMDIYTVTANLAGIPCLNINVGYTTKEKLPIGMQIFGPQFSEEKLLNVGNTYQQNFQTDLPNL